MQSIKPQLEIINFLSTLDWFIFGLVIIITLASIFFGHKLKKKTNSESESFLDLMLMGRQLTLPLFIATLVATWYGGIFGVAQIAFENGIYNFVTQGFFWYISYMIFAFFILKKISKYQAMTLPDIIGQMFGPKSEKLSAILNILNLVPIAYAISIGLLIQMLFGLGLNSSIIIGVVFVLGYSLFGGFRAVVFSDLIQFFVMCSTVILILVISIVTFGFSPLLTLPDSYFHPMGNYSLLETLSWGLIAISTLVDPNFYQRSFAAVDFKVAKKGILISTLIWITFDLCLTFGAMYAKAIIPEAESSHAYFIYAIQLLPEGLRGFALAGIAATILSTLDSYIFLAGSTISYDLVPKRLKGKVAIHHIGVVFIGILSIVLATVFEGNIKNVWKTLGSLSSAALLIPVLAGYIYPKRFNDNQFLIASFTGIFSTMIWRLGGYKYQYNLDEIYIGSFCCLMALLFTEFSSSLKNQKDD